MNLLNYNYKINIMDNPKNLNIDEFLTVGIRNNTKRRFLFISKMLGKHLPCSPIKCDEEGKLLAYEYISKYGKGERTTVIGFAETATALGHSFFNYLPESLEYVHTTRENIQDEEFLEFNEEHSHAVGHKLYLGYLKSINISDTVILVDDEITTANTCINIINKIHKRYPKKKYIIASILNWVNEENMIKIYELEKKLNCQIRFVYLFKGEFEFHVDEAQINKYCEINSEVTEKINGNSNIEITYIHLNLDNYICNNKYIKYTGRFGIDKEDQIKLQEVIMRECEKIITEKDSKKLVLGTEEFMYIPMLFAKCIEGEVHFHSTTRSPIIHCNQNNYDVKSKIQIKSYYNMDTVNYIYNTVDSDYDECFIFVELKYNEKLDEDIFKMFRGSKVKKVTVVICNKEV